MDSPLSDESGHWLIQLGRFELRGAKARRLLKLVGYSGAILIACVPGAIAFFAYAEGGTSLWAAVAFAVAIPVGVGLWLLRSHAR